MIVRLIAGAALGAALSTAAFAQSYTAPAGIPAATAPGGLEGTAAPRNVQRYDQRFGRPGIVEQDGVYTTGSVRVPQAGHRR